MLGRRLEPCSAVSARPGHAARAAPPTRPRDPRPTRRRGPDQRMAALSHALPACSSTRSTAASIRRRSSSRDSRWSPSLISSTVTAPLSRQAARRSEVCHGTSGSSWPCSRWTGQRSGIGAVQEQVALAVLEQPAGDRDRLAVGRRCQEHAVPVERRAMPRRELGQDQVVGEVGCRRDPDQPAHPLRAAASATSSMIQPPMLEPTSTSGPSVSAVERWPAHRHASRRCSRPRTGRRTHRGRDSRSAGRPGRAVRSAAPGGRPWRRSCRNGSRSGTGRSAIRPRRRDEGQRRTIIAVEMSCVRLHHCVSLTRLPGCSGARRMQAKVDRRSQRRKRGLAAC